VLCQDREQFDNLASLLGDSNPSADFIFQKYIQSSHGRDVRLLVVGGKVAAAMERRSRNGGFKSNISLGGVGEAINPPSEMAELAIKAAEVLRLDIAGIDVLYDERGYRICEANSSPGFAGLEGVCHISVPDKVFDFVATRFSPPATPPKQSIWTKLVSRVKRRDKEKV
jgi:gamma-F420-2:alpha-L-glutamate ligase